MDANETMLQPGGILGNTTLSCTGRGEQILQWLLENDFVMPMQAVEVPSYFPYNHDMKPGALTTLLPKGSVRNFIGLGSIGIVPALTMSLS